MKNKINKKLICIIIAILVLSSFALSKVFAVLNQEVDKILSYDDSDMIMMSITELENNINRLSSNMSLLSNITDEQERAEAENKINAQTAKLTYWVDDKTTNSQIYASGGAMYSDSELQDMTKTELTTLKSRIEMDNNNSAKSSYISTVNYWINDKNNYAGSYSTDGKPFTDEELQSMTLEEINKAIEEIEKSISSSSNSAKNSRKELMEYWKNDKIEYSEAYSSDGDPFTDEELENMTLEEVSQLYDNIKLANELKYKLARNDDFLKAYAHKIEKIWEEPEIPITTEWIEQDIEEIQENLKLILDTTKEQEEFEVENYASYYGEAFGGGALYFTDLQNRIDILCRQKGGTLHIKDNNVYGYTNVPADDIRAMAGGNMRMALNEKWIQESMSSELQSMILGLLVEIQNIELGKADVSVISGLVPPDILALIVNNTQAIMDWVKGAISANVPTDANYTASNANHDYTGDYVHQFGGALVRDLYSEYNVVGTFNANAREAYVLGTLGKYGTGYVADSQYAWWGTEAGGNNGGTGFVLDKAIQFETFITKASADAATSSTIAGDAGFKLKAPEWKTGELTSNNKLSYDNVTVKYNSETKEYIVGPYCIDYVELAEFGFIDELILYTNTNPDGIELKDGGNSVWNILHADEDGTFNDIKAGNKEYPKQQEPFYIVVNSNVTNITNVKAKIKYMNGRGQFNQLEGACTYRSYKFDSFSVYDYNGNVKGIKYYIDSQGIGTEPWQNLTNALNGMLWYQIYEIDTNAGIKMGRIEVEKIFKDANGKIVNDVDVKLSLEVTGTLDGDGTTTLSLESGNNNSVMSKEFLWEDDEDKPAPKFTLTEIIEPGDTYKVESMVADGGSCSFSGNSITGELENNVIKITVTNIVEKKDLTSGIDIKKVIETDKSLAFEEYESALEKKYPFLVTIIPGEESTFKYGGSGEYKDPLYLLVTSIGVEETSEDAANGIWKSEDVKWYEGTPAPSYKVEEIKTKEELEAAKAKSGVIIEPWILQNEEELIENIERTKIVDAKTHNDSGTFSEDITEHFKIVFTNEHITEKGKLSIIKRLDLSELDAYGLNEDTKKQLINELKDKFSFEFKVTIGNSAERTEILDSNNIRKTDTGYEWVWTEEVEWLKGNNPSYTITEVDNENSTTEFYKVESDNADDKIKIVGKIASGILRSDTEENYDEVYGVRNIYINKIKLQNTSLKILKTIGNLNDTNDVSIQKLLNGETSFKFNVDITGKFAYGSHLPFGEHTIRLTNDGFIILEADGTPADEDEAKKVEIKPVSQDNSLINNEWNSEEFTFIEGCEPTYKVEEDISTMTEQVTATLVKGNREGNFKDITNGIIEFEFNNTIVTTQPKEGRLYINKILHSDNEVSKDILSKYNFAFDVLVTTKDKTGGERVLLDLDNVVLEAESSGDLYIWEWYSEMLYWDPNVEETPIFTISEKVELLPSSINFKSASTTRTFEEITTELAPEERIAKLKEVNLYYPNEAKIEGLLDEINIDKEKTEIKFENEFKPQNAKISIDKSVQASAGEVINNTFKFQVGLEIPEGMTARYVVGEGDNRTVKQLTSGNWYFTNNDISESAENSVEIKFDGETAKNWTSARIEWDSEYATPKYTVKEIDSQGYLPDRDNITGYLSEKDDNGIVTVPIMNKKPTEPGPDNKFGYIKIDKVLDNSSLSEDEIKKLEFKFDIYVQNYGNKTISLQYDGNKTWSYISQAYEIPTDREFLEYKVTEVSLPAGTILESIELDEDTKSEGSTGTSNKVERSVSGKLTECGVTVPLTIKCINKSGGESRPREGSLAIKKAITHDSLKDKEFTFNVTVSGTFTANVNGQTHTIVNDKLELNNIIVKGGETVNVATFEWKNTDQAPRYTVEEVGNAVKEDEEISSKLRIENASGTISSGTVTLVTQTNCPIETGGYIKVTKQLEGDLIGQTSTREYEFIIKVYKKDKDNNDIQVMEFTDKISAGETWTSPRITWTKAEDAPTFSIEEVITEGVQLLSINYGGSDIRGQKAPVQETDEETSVEDIATVVIVNKTETPKQGRFVISKQAVSDSKREAPDDTFEIKFTITGTFEYNGTVKTGTLTDTISLNGGQSWTSPLIRWVGEAPIVKVEEINIPLGWTNTSIQNANSPLIENGQLDIIVTNVYSTLATVSLYVELGGTVWEDVPVDPSSKNTSDSVEDGILGSEEKLLEGVKVEIRDTATGQLAELRSRFGGGVISQPLVTNADGRWDVTIELSKLAANEFYVDFIYDGQTYEPTKYLAHSNGNAGAYINADLTGRDAFSKDSMATTTDEERNLVNNRLQKIAGKTPIDGEGNTTGIGIGTSSEVELYYTSNANDRFGSERITSKLVTTKEDRTVMDVFATRASTYVTDGGKLSYPFDEMMELADYDMKINHYTFRATYNYLKNINLGLKYREDADMSASKDLVDAKVVVNDKLLTYKFNKLSDLGKTYLTRTITDEVMDGFQTDSALCGLEYQLGLYKTDYYYRAELYKAGNNYDMVETFYKQFDNQTLEDTEMEIFLNYKISLYNESESYNIVINSIDDYSNESLELVSKDVYRYVQEANGTETEEKTLIAGPTLDAKENKDSLLNYIKSGDDINPANYQEQGSILGSDGTTYNKAHIELNTPIRLNSGDIKELYVTYKVKKSTVDGVKDAIILGDKSNIVEISGYSTYTLDGKCAGKVDCDSAPGNVNIAQFNHRDRYEDDTYAAPVLNIEFEHNENIREISGLAWEDRRSDGEEGVYEENAEALIGGLTTQLVEKVRVKNGSGYTEYDFVFPTNKQLSVLGGKTFEYLTGFDSTVETLRSGNVGQYHFENIPTGNYVVRFLYGIDKGTLEDATGATGDPVALKADGSLWNNSENEILTANYDDDQVSKTPAVYNGQDYKTTIYQLGTNTSNEMHTLTEKWDRDSDARDNESRRLEVIANSRIVTNDNAEEMIKANYKDGNHGALYEKYSMFADSAKVAFDINGDTTKELDGEYTINKQEQINKENYKDQKIENISVGLIERPENKIVLDKQVSSIKLTTNDNRVIFNANYNIEYEEVDDSEDRVVIEKINNKYLCAKVELNNETSVGIDVLQALNKIENKLTYNGEENGGTQNFRFINIDDTILQGTTIKIDYKLTALNVGETDTASEDLAKLSASKESSKEAVNTILGYAEALAGDNATYSGAEAQANSKVFNFGKYVGNKYYTGNIENDKIVTTRVRQVIDYVDNDAIFASADNMTDNHYWKNTTIQELEGYGLRDNRLLSDIITNPKVVLDKNNRTYISDTQNNLALSIDEFEANEEGTDNNGFELELVPYEQRTDDKPYKAEIALTISKTVSTDSDADNMTFDNLAEIVKYENSVGRRDIVAVPGNANPKLGEFDAALKERDSSATELITFTPPTGINAESVMQTQLIIAVLISLGVLATGIVIIKKKLL